MALEQLILIRSVINYAGKASGASKKIPAARMTKLLKNQQVDTDMSLVRKESSVSKDIDNLIKEIKDLCDGEDGKQEIV